MTASGQYVPESPGSDLTIARALAGDASSLALLLGPDGVILDLNRQMADRLGHLIEELKGTLLWPHLPPDSRASFQAVVQQVIDNRQPFGGDIQHAKQWYDLSLTPCLDENDRLTGIALVAWDIAKRKEAQAALVKARTHYQTLLETATDGIHVVSEDGHLMEASGHFYRMLGYLPEDAPSLQISDWDGMWSAGRMKALLAGLSDQPVVFETRHRRRDGREFDVEITARRIDMDGNRYLYASSRDVTERNQIEKRLRQSQKMEGIGRLAGGIAHEFNNILAAMMMNLNLAKMSSLDAEARDFLGEMEGLSQRAAALIKQLLAFSRQSIVQLQPTDLAAVVSRQCPFVERLVGAGIRLEYSSAEGLPWVNADKGLIEQVLLNLCLNARDAMKTGGRLQLRLEGTEVGIAQASAQEGVQPGKYICLSVTDTGCGMDETTRKKLFEPFLTTKKVGQGTGLGLATVLGIVQQHHGWVEVESCVGKGSTFRVYLPAMVQPLAIEPVSEQQGPARGQCTILVVEDEVTVRKATRMVLARVGYAVLEAANGEEALALWHTHRGTIDLVYTDMVMPGNLTGLQLVEQILADQPGVKAIITSGYNTDLVDLDRIAESSIVYLPKPCDAERLTLVIRKCLQQQ